MQDNQDGLFEGLVDNVFEGVYYVDVNRTITYWNTAAESIAGFKRADVMGNCCADNILRHIDAEGNELCMTGCPLSAVLQDGKIHEADVYLHHKNGHRVAIQVRAAPVRDRDGIIIGALEVFSDKVIRNETLKEMEKLKQEVYTDPLTGVGNRRFAELVEKRLCMDSKQTGLEWGVVFLDIDHFKKFNDTWGHDVGDQVLRMTAKTVQTVLRSMDSLCRMGGEEFAIFIPMMTTEKLQEIAERIRLFVERSFIMIEGKPVAVTVSLGVTLHHPGEDETQTLKRADTLMYQSKQAGRNRVTFES